MKFCLYTENDEQIEFWMFLLRSGSVQAAGFPGAPEATNLIFEN